MADRSGKSLKQIIRDTKRVDFYLDAWRAKEYGLIDRVLGANVAPERVDTAAAEEVSAPSAAPVEVSIHGRTEP
jgi:hypothetical protein